MSRKHNTKHFSRGSSNYPRSLADRGETNVSARMRDYLGIGRKAEAVTKSGDKYPVSHVKLAR